MNKDILKFEFLRWKKSAFYLHSIIGHISIEIGDHSFLIGCHFQNKIVKTLSALNGRKVHLEIIRILMNIQKQTSFIAFVKAHTTNHISRKQPVVNLFAIVFHTLQTQIPYLNRFLFSSEINVYVTWHKYLGWFEHKKL